jgi:hypothetical protein
MVNIGRVVTIAERLHLSDAERDRLVGLVWMAGGLMSRCPGDNPRPVSRRLRRRRGEQSVPASG